MRRSEKNHNTGRGEENRMSDKKTDGAALSLPGRKDRPGAIRLPAKEEKREEKL